MSEYNVLLKPTRIDEKWYEVPKFTACGVHKQIVNTWEEVVECGEDFGYETRGKGLLTKKCNFHGDNQVEINFFSTGEILVGETKMACLDYNKMVFFMLLLEGKL